jgi:hypothetical protein
VGGWGNYLVILFVGKKIIINKVGRKGLPRWGQQQGWDNSESSGWRHRWSSSDIPERLRCAPVREGIRSQSQCRVAAGEDVALSEYPLSSE